VIFISAKIFRHYGRNILVVHTDNEVTAGSHDFGEAAEMYDKLIARYLAWCEEYAALAAGSGNRKTEHRKLVLHCDGITETSAAVTMSLDDGNGNYSYPERHIWKRIKGRWLMTSRENLHDRHNI